MADSLRERGPKEGEKATEKLEWFKKWENLGRFADEKTDVPAEVIRRIRKGCDIKGIVTCKGDGLEMGTDQAVTGVWPPTFQF